MRQFNETMSCFTFESYMEMLSTKEQISIWIFSLLQHMLRDNVRNSPDVPCGWVLKKKTTRNLRTKKSTTMTRSWDYFMCIALKKLEKAGRNENKHIGWIISSWKVIWAPKIKLASERSWQSMGKISLIIHEAESIDVFQLRQFC